MQRIQSLRIGNFDTTSQGAQHLHNVKQTEVSSYMYRTIVSLKQISQLSTHLDNLFSTVLFTESFNSKSAPACNNVIAMAVFLLRSAICNAGSGPTSISHPFSSNDLQTHNTSIICHDSLITFLPYRTSSMEPLRQANCKSVYSNFSIKLGLAEIGVLIFSCCYLYVEYVDYNTVRT